MPRYFLVNFGLRLKPSGHVVGRARASRLQRPEKVCRLDLLLLNCLLVHKFMSSTVVARSDHPLDKPLKVFLLLISLFFGITVVRIFGVFRDEGRLVGALPLTLQLLVTPGIPIVDIVQ